MNGEIVDAVVTVPDPNRRAKELAALEEYIVVSEELDAVTMPIDVRRRVFEFMATMVDLLGWKE